MEIKVEEIVRRKLNTALIGLSLSLANEAVNWSIGNFRRQGWPGSSFEPWRRRKAGAKRNKGRAILVDTARLKRSIRVLSVKPLGATIGTTGVPYARVHNYGFDGAVQVPGYTRKRSIADRKKIVTVKAIGHGKNIGPINVKPHGMHMRIPRRQYIGYSPVLYSILRHKAIVHLGRAFK